MEMGTGTAHWASKQSHESIGSEDVNDVVVPEEVGMMPWNDFEKLTSDECNKKSDKSAEEGKPATVTNSVVSTGEAI